MPTTSDEIYEHGHHRIRELKTAISKAQNEIKMWEEIIEQQGYRGFCGDCGMRHGTAFATVPPPPLQGISESRAPDRGNA